MGNLVSADANEIAPEEIRGCIIFFSGLLEFQRNNRDVMIDFIMIHTAQKPYH